MKYIKPFTASLAAALGCYATAQLSPYYFANQPHNGSSNLDDEAVAVTSDSKGNAYYTGNSKYKAGSPASAIWTYKLNSLGDTQWSVLGRSPYNDVTGENDFAKGIALDSLGNVYVVAEANRTSLKSSMLLAKFNPSGKLVWTQLYTPQLNMHNVPVGVGVDSLDRITIAGTTGDAGSAKFAIAQYSGSGMLNWHHEYIPSVTNSGVCSAMKVLPSGKCYLAGALTTSSIARWVVEYDSTGSKVADSGAVVDGTTQDSVTAMDVASDGSVCITGKMLTSGLDVYSFTQRFDINLVPQWTYLYGSPANPAHPAASTSYAVAFGPDGSVYATGAVPDTSPNSVGTLVKFDKAGNKKFATSFGPASPKTRGTCLAVDANGRVYVGYEITSGTAAYLQCGILTVDGATGIHLASTSTGDSTQVDHVSAMKIDSLGRIFLAGSYHVGTHNEDFLSSAYVQPCITGPHSYSVQNKNLLKVDVANGVLGNANYNVAATAVLVGQPSHGSVTLFTDGSFNYVPQNGYTGMDKFTIKAYQYSLYGNVSTVTINVTP